MAFSHEVVPDYLRTKPEPEVEERVQMMSVKASSMAPDTTQVLVSQNKKNTYRNADFTFY